ncbi:MAG: MFS transporter, partial [Asgard group archaeon]|nr:MFS transporter [Asgard group archaeon]
MSNSEDVEIEETVLTPREIILKPRMEPNEPGELNIKKTILHSVAFLAALVALTYYNIAVPVILKQDLVPADFIFLGFIPRMTFINFLMTIDNILAVTLQPFFASLSDRTASRFGRRMPYLIIGIIGSAIFFGVAPWIQVLAGFVGMLFCYNIFMSFFRSPALALVADYTEEKLRSTASGIQQLIANIGTIVAFGVPIIVGLFISKNMDKVQRDLLINRIGFPIISVVMLICLAILVFATQETPTGEGFLKLTDEKIAVDSMNFEIVECRKQEEEQPKKKTNAFFLIFKKEYLSILLLLLAVFFWFSGFGAIEANFSNLGNDYYGLPMDQTSMLGLVYPITMIAASLPMGLIGQKLGRKRTLYLCLGMLIVCLSLISF